MKHTLYICLMLLLSTLYCKAAYNAGIEIRKDDLKKFYDYSMQFSDDRISWTNLDEHSPRRDNFFCAEMTIPSNCEMYYFRFVKPITNYYIQVEISGTNATEEVRESLESDMFAIDIYKQKTHFIKCSLEDKISDGEIRSKHKSASGKPPTVNLDIVPHKVLRKFISGKEIASNGNIPVILYARQNGTVVECRWSHDFVSSDPVSYEVVLGHKDGGIISKSYCQKIVTEIHPPHTGKYWCQIVAAKPDGIELLSEICSFEYVAPDDTPGLDSDGDGYSDTEELLHGSDPNDAYDVPIILAEQCVNMVLTCKCGQYFSHKFSVKNNENVVWSSGKLPDGLTIDQSGLLSGLPTKAGEFDIEIMASDFFDRHSDAGSVKLTVENPVQSKVVPGGGGLK